MSHFLAPGVAATFDTNVKLEGQEHKSALLPFVNADLNSSDTGDRWTDETYGRIDYERMKGEIANTPDNELGQYRRFAFWTSDHIQCWLRDSVTKEQLIDPKGPATMAFAMADQRHIEKEIFDKILYAETQNETDEDENINVVTFPTANTIAVDEVGVPRGKIDPGFSSPTGAALDYLTPAKLRQSKIILAKGEEKSMSMPIVPVEEEDVQNLLTSEELHDRDIAKLERLEEGDLTTWGGFQFVKVAPGRLRNVPGTTDQFETVVYLREYAHFKRRQLKSYRMAERPDKNHQTQLYAAVQSSGMRSRDAAFVRIRFRR